MLEVGKQLTAAESVIASDRLQFERDYEDLLTLPGVRGVEVHGHAVTVHTEPIIIDWEGARYRIGEFALLLDFEHGIQIVNLKNTGPKVGWDHPHVQGHLPYLGNMRDGFEKLLGECQLVPLVSMMLQYLETYHPDTAYTPIEQWQREPAGVA